MGKTDPDLVAHPVGAGRHVQQDRHHRDAATLLAAGDYREILANDPAGAGDPARSWWTAAMRSGAPCWPTRPTASTNIDRSGNEFQFETQRRATTRWRRSARAALQGRA
jgi:hypothetical protein